MAKSICMYEFWRQNLILKSQRVYLQPLQGIRPLYEGDTLYDCIKLFSKFLEKYNQTINVFAWQ